MDLNAPLGMSPPPRRPRRLGLVLAAGIAAAVLCGLGWILVTADPHGGEPYVVAAIPPAAPKAAPAPASVAVPIDPMQTGSANGAKPVEAGRVENGVTVYRGERQGEPPAADRGPLVIDVAKALDDPHRLARMAPVAAPEGTPKDAYKDAYKGATGTTPLGAAAPRIAIFVSGMGLSDSATRTATEIMPPAVTLAFVPYGATVARSVAAAKAKGHEVLLQLPMQSGAGGPPGPHALQPGEAGPAVSDDMAWLLRQFDGYDGVANLLGAPVTADRDVMTAVLEAVAAHRLFYVDDGTSRRSLGPSLATRVGIPAVQADIVLDATADPAVVRANLDTLETIARRKGAAIGMASGLPEHLAAIAAFAGDLRARGIELVPVAAIVGRDASRAATR